ncbi:MAG TPA: PEP-CTERM sorting domain-containing protein [Rhizomicrobium sp.]
MSRLIKVAGFLLLAAAGSANADTMYSSQTAFNAAISGATTITFNGLAPAGNFVFYGTGSLTLSGVTFTGNDQMYVIDPTFYGSSYPGGDFLTSDYASPDVITATLPSVTAVGFNLGGLFDNSLAINAFTILLSDGSSFTVDVPGNESIQDGTLGFFGVTSSTPLTSIRISLPDSPAYNAIDNFEFASPSAVPEPLTLSLFGAGLAGAIAMRRRKAKG